MSKKKTNVEDEEFRESSKFIVFHVSQYSVHYYPFGVVLSWEVSRHEGQTVYHYQFYSWCSTLEREKYANLDLLPLSYQIHRDVGAPSRQSYEYILPSAMHKNLLYNEEVPQCSESNKRKCHRIFEQ